MTNYPHVLTKMQAELDSVLGKQLATWEDSKSLPYTMAVIKEVIKRLVCCVCSHVFVLLQCLRFRPIIQFFIHTTTEDLTANYKGKEYNIPQGTVLWPTYGAMHVRCCVALR